jgi:hypothetical protein
MTATDSQQQDARKALEAPLSRSWEEARQAVDAAVTALSQERACSTCRSLDYADVGRERPVCQHRDSPLRHLGTVRPETFGCLLWEQADQERA